MHPHKLTCDKVRKKSFKDGHQTSEILLILFPRVVILDGEGLTMSCMVAHVYHVNVTAIPRLVIHTLGDAW